MSSLVAIASSMPALGQPLPVPAGFPVAWANPAQARQLWMLDRVHFSKRVLPLVADIYQSRVAAGFNRAADWYQLPVRIEFIVQNGYLYNSAPLHEAPPESIQKGLHLLKRVAPRLFNAVESQVVKGMTAKYMARIAPVMITLEAQWQQSWRPEVQQHLAFWHDFDLTNAPQTALLGHLEESLKRIERLWALHFEIVVPSAIALSRFVDEYQGLLDSKDHLNGDPFSVFALPQAIDHSFLEGDMALWQLGRLTRTLPVVGQIIVQNPAPVVISLLANHVEGQIFLAELQVWLEKYGQRGNGADGLSSPSWLDDPTPVLHNLHEILALPDHDVVAEMQTHATIHAQRIAHARQRLRSQPASSSTQAQERFESLLQAAQWGEFLLTEHNFWIDQQAMYRLRLVLLELGHRCVVAGSLDEAQDAFYLSLDELVATVQSMGGQRRQTLVADRKRHFEHFHSLTPPDALGAMPWMVPPDEPFVRAMSRLFGASLVPTHLPTKTVSTVVYGQAAAPGKVRGVARVIRTLEEAERLQAGEILVTIATMPSWTPLLVIAGGVVTDAGGILSHAAIIAREYGIPAVVATRIATERIVDGQLLEVDGSTGVITLVQNSAAINRL